MHKVLRRPIGGSVLDQELVVGAIFPDGWDVPE